MALVNLISSAQFLIDYDNFAVITDSRHVDVNVADLVAKYLSKKLGSCCSISLVGNLDEEDEFNW